MKNKLILVEDDADLGMVLRQYLEFSGFEVNWFHAPEELLSSTLDFSEYSMAILDIMLPEMNGFELSKELRKHTNLPFLFLTAKGQSIDRILGLKIGAEDYITKPCEPEELILRINNILKRKTDILTEYLQIGTYTFHPSHYLLKYQEESIHLTEKESDLLVFLYANNKNVVSRKDILEKIWGENDYFLGRSLDVFMTRLRKYLQKDDQIKLESVRGVGFRIFFP